MPKRREIKAFAKQAIKNRSPRTGIVTLVYIVIVLVLDYLSGRLSAPSARYTELLDEMVSTGWQNPEALQEIIERANAMMESGATSAYSGPLASILTLAISVITMLLGVGFIFYCVRVSRGVNAGFGDLFDGFGNFGKVFLANLLKGLIVFAWGIPSYLLGIFGAAFIIVGAIVDDMELFVMVGLVLCLAAVVLTILPAIASYRYALPMYVIFDDPNVGVSEALRRSKILMKGNKWKLFVMDLSFLGWYILSIVPFVALFVAPYVGVSKAEFYNCLRGFGHNSRPVAESEPIIY